jgi:ATP-binding cassette subfamily F protein 3
MGNQGAEKPAGGFHAKEETCASLKFYGLSGRLATKGIVSDISVRCFHRKHVTARRSPGTMSASRGSGNASGSERKMVLLSLQGIGKSFVMNRVLSDVTLTVKQGQRMGLVGVNGSGKSTLFKIISGEMKPDEGSMSLMKGTRVGLLTQQADLLDDLTVWEELARVFDPLKQQEARLRALEHEMAESHNDPAQFSRLSNEYARLTERFEADGGYEWPSRIQGVLAGLGFAKDRQDQKASSLSGGEKTRLCLARILLIQPELLMLDEPTNHLDLNATAWLEEALKKYRARCCSSPTTATS